MAIAHKQGLVWIFYGHTLCFPSIGWSNTHSDGNGGRHWVINDTDIFYPTFSNYILSLSPE
jgi:hypothetical protein